MMRAYSRGELRPLPLLELGKALHQGPSFEGGDFGLVLFPLRRSGPGCSFAKHTNDRVLRQEVLGRGRIRMYRAMEGDDVQVLADWCGRTDGKTLYVANADNNDVMVVDISEPGESRIAGFIPVGWYPTALAVSPDSQYAVGGQRQGTAPGPSYPPRVPRKAAHGVAFDHPGKLLEGSIAVIPRPDAAALAATRSR